MNNSALQNRNYLIYLTGNTISLHGLWIYRVALGWFAWQLTESELWIGIVAFTQFAPAVLLGPVFGVLADRFDRRLASLFINSISIMNMLLFGLLAYMGKVDIYVLTLLSLMQGTLDGAHMPVRMSVVPNLVHKEQLRSAIAITSISFNVSRFVGPAIAGIVIAGFSVAAAFVINGLSYFFLIAAMVIVRLNPASARTQRPKHVWLELKDGVRYVLHHQSIRAVLIIIALASILARGALEMMPAFADAVFQGGSAALATLTSAIGAGAIVAGMILSRSTEWLTVKVIRIAAAGGGLLIALLGVIENFQIAVAVVVLLGVVLSMVGIGSQILVQTLVDDEVRGRVSSLWGMIAFGGTALGSLLVGSAASAWSLQSAVLVTGVLCCVAAVLSGLRSSH